MALLSPPTDNLYKFIAIAGLVLLVGPWFVYFPESRELSARSFQTQRRIASNQKQVELTNAEAVALGRQLSELNKIESQTLPPGSPDSDKRRDLKARNEALQQRLATSQVNAAETGVDTVEITELQTQAKRLLVSSVFFTIAGALLSLLGFYLWFTRVQRFEDAALVTRAKTESSPAFS
jgi:hypothetical protein